jgi:hypothetical protein
MCVDVGLRVFGCLVVDYCLSGPWILLVNIRHRTMWAHVGHVDNVRPFHSLLRGSLRLLSSLEQP